MRRLLLSILTVVAVASCDGNAQISNVVLPPVVPTSDVEAKAQDVTVCDLKNDPAKYNHVVVKVTGYFSRGFEDSTFYDPSCKAKQWIWVEMGGKRSVGVMYCCGFTPKSTRDEELQVEGLKLPLVEDENFKKYDALFANGKNKVKATVIGTFFSGKKTKFAKDSPEFYGGYGHMGIGSLFIVQQVLSSEPTTVENKLE